MMYAAVLRALLASLAGLAACASPEAARTQGGGPGADVGNRAPIVELHGGARPYYKTPCVTPKVKCTGPPAVFGTTPTSG
jgi:hypothetical protein